MVKVPRYSQFRPSSKTSSEIKKRNRSKDTEAELVLRRELWRRGLRYRVDVKNLPGKPDIVFARARVVVFCDGDFWHGRDWRRRKARLARGSNSEYWIAKIQSNLDRDRRIRRALQQTGWTVLRFWESSIFEDFYRIADAIVAAVNRD